MSKDSIIKVDNVYKNFQNDKIKVLKGVNLEIKPGEFVSLMGASGSGKSTLLYLIGGLDQPTSGEVKIDNKNISKMNDTKMSKLRRKEIGFIFQFYNLVQNLTVEENILLPVIMDGRKKKQYEKKLNELLEIVGLSEKKNALPSELSGGEQQRVAIARAVIMDPKIILADEATGNLDSKTGQDIMELFKKINKEKGITILQVTHSEEIANYGDRIIQLKDGQII